MAQIDSDLVAKRLAQQLGELVYQAAQYTVLIADMTREYEELQSDFEKYKFDHPDTT